MKRTALFALMISLLLGGCARGAEDEALIRQRQESWRDGEIAFSVSVMSQTETTAFSYRADCLYAAGETQVTLTAPETVAGITARIASGQTALEYDGIQLETGPLNSDGLSPMDALPAFFEAMESGYMAETGTEMIGETEVLRICCRDPELDPGQGLETVLWFDKAQKTLLQGEVRSDGFTVIRCEFSAFILVPDKTV
ncbi:MAG: hypothetical protein IKK44_01605 [Clostridium sp.]|nr:hypothetical protein [Clostridium sp.]